MKRPQSVPTSLALVLALILTLPLLVACSVDARQSGDTAASASAGERPPLLDRELFFGDPEISNAELSPDGRYMAFIKPYRDVRNIWVKKIDEPFDAARPMTADERPVPGYFWSRDGKYLLYVQDKDGNENFNVWAVDPAGERAADTGVPTARNLTPIDGVRAVIYSVPKNSPGEIVVGLNDRDQAFHDVYRITLASGERELVLENTQQVGSWVYDLDGNVRMAMRQTEDGSAELLRVDTGGGKGAGGGDGAGEVALVPIYSCSYEESCFPVRFHKDGKRLYLSSNKGSRDLAALLLMDATTGETELVESDPEGQVDFGGAAFSDKTDELMATVYVGDRVRIYPKTDAARRDLAYLREELPDGELGISSTTADMRYMLVNVSRDVDPGSVYLYDRDNKTLKLQYRSRPELPSEHLASMQPIRYKARDGLEIPAFLTLPRGVASKNLPAVIHPHGGPWSRDTWGYDPYAQFLANRGYAVLQMNFRGSTGYGKAFLNAGNREWGTGAMQHDITDGVKYLIDQGIADPERVAIFGGSYGGYATLAGVTFTPELYAAGVPYVAPSSIITLIESFPAYWRPWLEGTWYERVGDPEVEADRKDMEARSPLNHVDRIKVPLLVVHGANDPRVKQSESDRIVAALANKGHHVEYIVAPDEGHGFRSPENRMALAAAMEKFLAGQLGGRYQDDVPDAIAARLGEITVDAKSVKVAGAAAGDEAAPAKVGAGGGTDGG